MNGFQDLISRFGPDKRFGVLLVDFEILFGCRFQFFRTSVRSTPYLVLSNGGKPALNEVHPRGTRWRKMKMKPFAGQQPVMHQGGYVGTVVVQYDVNLQIFGN